MSLTKLASDSWLPERVVCRNKYLTLVKVLVLMRWASLVTRRGGHPLLPFLMPLCVSICEDIWNCAMVLLRP